MTIVIEVLTAMSLWIGLAAILVFILLLPTFLYFLVKRRGKAILLMLTSILVSCVLVAMAQDVIFIRYMRDNLSSASQIKLGKNSTKSAEELVSALKDIRILKGKSGSHPIGGFEFSLIINQNEYDMRVEKDSRDENMYWVYYEGYPIGAELGFIVFE